MRTKPFTFKKTVKRTVTHAGLEVNLTVSEAEELLGIMDEGSQNLGPDETSTPVYDAMGDLYDALVAFVEDNDV